MLYVAPFAQSKTIFNFLFEDVLVKVLFKNSEYLPDASSNLLAFPGMQEDWRMHQEDTQNF